MDNIKCFLIEPTEFYEQSLRRYAAGSNCNSLWKYHNAENLIDKAKARDPISGDLWPHDDARWPKHCSCGYEFAVDDEWQVNYQCLYICKETGLEMTLFDAPTGAMWRATWLEEVFKGPDGQCLILRTPGGDWIIDGHSTNGNGWTRTGIAPNITAYPSIQANDYHGWLTNGMLIKA